MSRLTATACLILLPMLALAETTPPISLFPALTSCQAARAQYPTGAAYAAHFRDRAAQTHDGVAEFCLSFMPTDPTEALRWLEQSATKGLPEAQLLLGSAYEVGHGVPQDPKKAWAWYSAAAHHDFGPAQYELAAILYSGQRLGHAHNYAHALFWAELAASHHVPDAKELREVLRSLVPPAQQTAIRQAVTTWKATHQKPSQPERRQS